MTIDFNPPFIIFSNTDIVQSIQDTLTRQLFLTEIINAPTFDARVIANPNYPSVVHSDGYRILVLRDLSDHNNRQLADIVLFFKNGLAAVEINKFGPHGITLPIDRLYLTALITQNVPNHRLFPGRPNIYDGFPGHPREAYNRNYDPFRLDPPISPEPPDE